MTAVLHTSALAAPTTTRLRPRYEGSNICTWIGFKHVNYLIEEAVLEHFRSAGLPARELYEEHGLCLDVVELDTRIAHALHQDDLAVLTVTPVSDDGTFTARVALTVDRPDGPVRAATAKVQVVLRQDQRHGPTGSPVPEVAGFTVPELRAVAPAGQARKIPVAPVTAGSPGPGGCGCGGAHGQTDPALAALGAGQDSFAWSWRIPYFSCRFRQWVQMSGYLRVLEEAVDLFLAHRGISIRALLDERNWIPVVPRSTVRVLDEALMEEDLYTVFTVQDVFKDFTYTARMDSYVRRGGALLPTATATITHGYALIDNRSDWRLVNFDARVLSALGRSVQP